MLKRDLTRLVGTMLLGGVVMLTTLPACGGANAGGTTADLTTPQVTATSQPTATGTGTAIVPQVSVTATPTATVAPGLPIATAAPAPTTSPTGPSDSDLLAQGKLIFEKTAGGLGCAFCHGLDGKGSGPAGVFTPNIRGKDEGYIRRAIQSGVPAMAFIKLSDEEITAVAAYLQYLVTQP